MARRCKTHILQDLELWQLPAHTFLCHSGECGVWSPPAAGHSQEWSFRTPRGVWPSLGKSHLHVAVLMGCSLIREDTR